MEKTYELNDLNALCEELKCFGFNIGIEDFAHCGNSIKCILIELGKFFSTIHNKQQFLDFINKYINPQLTEDEILEFIELEEFTIDR